MSVKKSYNTIFFQALDSTNTYAMENLSTLSDKDVIIAEIQHSGKGRFDRKWISDIPENVYLSIVLKFSNNLSCNFQPAELTRYISLIICEALEKYNVTPSIKPPNDVFIEGKKIAGVLSQAVTRGNNLKGLVLGVGINLNLSEDNLKRVNQPATALNLLINDFVNKDIFIENLLNNFFASYNLFLEKGFSLIKQKYESRILKNEESCSANIGMPD